MNEILINALPRVTVDEDYGRIIVRPPTHVRKYPILVTHLPNKTILEFQNLYGINFDISVLRQEIKIYQSIYSTSTIGWKSIEFTIDMESSKILVELIGPQVKNIEAMTYVDFPIKGVFRLLKNGAEIKQFNLPNDKDYEYIDSIDLEQGNKYIYGLQQTDREVGIAEVAAVANWEDILLSDENGKTLRIRYNPKISSFKTTILEQKTDTIGGKYPFFFRNGDVSYKEMPISGLISYQADDLMLFDKNFKYFPSSRQREATMSYQDYEVLQDEFYLERKYKRAVEEWLSNGRPKYLRTAAEGNFVVRLMNVSLSPNDQLGRRLHTFSATAYEIEDYPFKTPIYTPPNITTDLIKDPKGYIDIGYAQDLVNNSNIKPIYVQNVGGLLIESVSIKNESNFEEDVYVITNNIKEVISLAPEQKIEYSILDNTKWIKIGKFDSDANFRLQLNYISYIPREV